MDQLKYSAVEGWEQLPKGMAHRDVAGVAVDQEDRVYLICRGENPVIIYDRDGNYKGTWGKGDFSMRTHGIYVAPNGTIFCTDDGQHTVRHFTPDGKWTVFAEFDGEPNGLRVHKDGKRLFVADHKLGLLSFDIATGKMSVVLNRPHHEGFKGLNDLTFASNGDLYFTDQGQTGLHDPTGRVYRLRADGTLNCLIRNIPSPNGIALDREERNLYVNVTRANQVWRLPLLSSGEVTKVGIFLQLSGGTGGPDGLAVDETGGLTVAHAGFGCVWMFDKLGEPLYRIKSCAGHATTNIAFGGEDMSDAYITLSETGRLVRVRWDEPGRGAVVGVDQLLRASVAVQLHDGHGLGDRHGRRLTSARHLEVPVGLLLVEAVARARSMQLVADEPRHDRLALQIDALGIGPRQLLDIHIGANRNEPVLANGHGLGDLERVVDRDDLAVEQDDVGRRRLCLLRVHRQRQRQPHRPTEQQSRVLLHLKTPPGLAEPASPGRLDYMRRRQRARKTLCQCAPGRRFQRRSAKVAGGASHGLAPSGTRRIMLLRMKK